MKRHTISMFRVNLPNYEEPVEVTVQGRVVGTWIPAEVRRPVERPKEPVKKL